MEQITYFISRLKARCLSKMMNPRYQTSCWQTWTFFQETLQPASESQANNAFVSSQHFSQLWLARSRSSTYWSKVQLGFSLRKDDKSPARASPNKVGEFLNP
jgi:transposase